MKKRMLILFLAVFMLTLLPGCGSSAVSEKEAVVFVIARTANSKALSYDAPLVTETVYRTILNEGWLAFVNADGQPSLAFSQSFQLPSAYQHMPLQRRELDAKANSAEALTVMRGVVADDPEIDLLAALRLAARILNSLDGYQAKSIIVLSSGLSTAGDLNLQNNLLMAEPDSVADQLEELEAIPSLDGLTITWLQMGDTAAPQQDFTERQRNQLTRLWTAVIERGGGRLVCNAMIPALVQEDAEYPYVTPVELWTEPPIAFAVETLREVEAVPEAEVEHVAQKEPEEPVSVSPFAETTILTERQVEFIPDSARFKSRERADETLTPIAEYMISHPETKILLAGSIAGDTGSGKGLPLERARAVKTALCEMGCEENRIVAIGLAPLDDPYHIRNAGYSGPVAQQNRHVLIMDLDSILAQALLSAQGQGG